MNDYTSRGASDNPQPELTGSNWEPESEPTSQLLDNNESDSPIQFRGDEDAPLTRTELDDDRLATSIIARSARDAFRAAREAHDSERAESNFHEAKDKLLSLWQYALVRNQEFHDLLALIDVAIRYADFANFSSRQSEIVFNAFFDLCKVHLEPQDVSRHVNAFRTHEIDSIGPIRNLMEGKRFKITIEEA